MAQQMSRRKFFGEVGKAGKLAAAVALPDLSLPEAPPQQLETPLLQRAAKRLAAVLPDILIPRVSFSELADMTKDQNPHATLRTMLNYVDYYTTNRKIPELKDKPSHVWVAPETTLRIGKGDCDGFAFTLALLKKDIYKPYIAALVTPDNNPVVNHMVYPYGDDEHGWYVTSAQEPNKAVTRGPEPTLVAAMDDFMNSSNGTYTQWMVFNLEWDPIKRNDPHDDIDIRIPVPGKEHVLGPDAMPVKRGYWAAMIHLRNTKTPSI